MKKLGIAFLTLFVLCSFSLTAFAVEFTPSVERLLPPTPVETTDISGEKRDVTITDEKGNEIPIVNPSDLVKIPDSKGNECDAIITDKNGNETAVVNASDSDIKLVITPISEKDNAIVKDITEMLDSAETQIKKADNLGELTPSMEEALQEMKVSISDPAIRELEIRDLVVCNIFDVSLVRDGAELVALEEGETLTFAIQTDFTKDDVLFVLHNISGETWEVVNDISLDEKGVLTITLNSLSTLAIVTDNMQEKAVDHNAPTSPQTGDVSGNALPICAAAFGAAALILFAYAVFARKKQTEK